MTAAWNRTEAERLVSCAPKSYEWAQVLVAGLRDAIAEIDRLTERQQAHLQLVAKLTRETPYPEELRECRTQRAALIAEVGTLRAAREADAIEAASNHATALAEVARLRASRGRARLRSANALRDRDAHAARCVELARQVTELEQQLAERADDHR